jgi:hypothetical protein
VRQPEFLADDRADAARGRLVQGRLAQRPDPFRVRRPAAQDSDAPLAGEVRADRGEPAARHAERAEPAAVAKQSERGQADVAADAVEDDVHLSRGLADP